MAKRFRHEKKVDINKGTIEDEYKVEEIAERVSEEKIEEEIISEVKDNKEDFLKSKGLQDRPTSHMAITAWEEYKAS